MTHPKFLYLYILLETETYEYIFNFNFNFLIFIYIIYNMPARKYTAKQKAAYARKKALQRARYRSKYVKGHGDYSIPRNFFSAPKLGQWLGSNAGGAIGSYIAPGIGTVAGSELGGQAGRQLGKWFKSVTGWGDYTVKQNSLMFPNQEVPSFGEDTIRVRKREMVCEINSLTTGFTNQAFPINPGLDQSFPWLSAIAKNYEQYRFNGLIYQFVSTSSDAIASTTALGLGQVILATDYSAIDDDFEDPAQMLGTMFSTSGKPSENIMHAIECAPDDTAQKLYYVRTGDAVGNSDKRLWDLGKFQIATNNMPAAYTGMGQLWVSYDCTFCKSVQNNQLGFAINTDFWSDLKSYTPTNSSPFGSTLTTSTASPDSGSNLGCSINNNTLFFPEGLFTGYYMINISWSGTAASIVAPSRTYIGANEVKCYYTTNDSIIGSPANAVSSAKYQMTVVIKLKNPQQTNGQNYCQMVLSSVTLPSSITAASLMITQVNGDIFNDYSLA